MFIRSVSAALIALTKVLHSLKVSAGQGGQRHIAYRHNTYFSVGGIAEKDDYFANRKPINKVWILGEACQPTQ